jgi:hypothetical protein
LELQGELAAVPTPTVGAEGDWETLLEKVLKCSRCRPYNTVPKFKAAMALGMPAAARQLLQHCLAILDHHLGDKELLLREVRA